MHHSFLVPAYGNSPYIEECIQSLLRQSIASKILVSTSTPTPELAAMAKEYGIEIFEHGPNKGIAHDWNTGLKQIKTEWVTIAHQDDVYLPTFAFSVLNGISAANNPSLIFTDYAEISGNHIRSQTPLLCIKQVLLQLGFFGRKRIGSRWSKINSLRFGSPIPCPSVTLRSQPHPPQFELGFKLNMDWAAWLRKAQEPGEFVWIREVLMHHRIHEFSETTEGIEKGYRIDEDLQILQRIWPKSVARAIAATYAIAYKSNSH